MNLSYLAIDRDEPNHEVQSRFWKTRNISAKRVSSMAEGINETALNEYLFIGINSSTVKEYKLDLSYMRRATNIPILISANIYDPDEHGKTTVLGADLYGQLHENPIDNFTSITGVLKRINDIGKNNNCPAKILTHHNVLMLLMQRQVFVGDELINLTKQDYNLLKFFLANCGCALSFEQLYNNVWRSEYDESANTVIKNAIARLRKKVSGKENDTSLIDNLWGYGYKCKEIK
jgi:DNA-binding response OmpR family regulator